MTTATAAEATCYHLWAVADGGNAMFRRRRCFTSRTAANKARKTSGFSVATEGKAVSVMQCMPECPCRGRGCPAATA